MNAFLLSPAEVQFLKGSIRQAIVDRLRNKGHNVIDEGGMLTVDDYHIDMDIRSWGKPRSWERNSDHSKSVQVTIDPWRGPHDKTMRRTKSDNSIDLNALVEAIELDVKGQKDKKALIEANLGKKCLARKFLADNHLKQRYPGSNVFLGREYQEDDGTLTITPDGRLEIKIVLKDYEKAKKIIDLIKEINQDLPAEDEAA